MSQYKATYDYLYNIGVLKDKPKDLMQFWEEAWFFERVNWQRMQNMKCLLTKDQLLDSYNDYLQNPPLDKKWKIVVEIDNGKDDYETVIFLKFRPYEFDHHRYWKVYLYSIQKKIVYERVVRQSLWKKEKYFRHGNKTHNIFDFITN